MFGDDEVKETFQTGPMVCGHCDRCNYEVHIGHSDKGNTCLIMYCCTPGCEDKMRKMVQAEPDAHVFSAQFDITGQGYDETDVHSQHVTNNPEDLN